MERKAKSKTETGNEMMSNNITYTYTSYTYTIPIPAYNTVIFLICNKPYKKKNNLVAEIAENIKSSIFLSVASL